MKTLIRAGLSPLVLAIVSLGVPSWANAQTADRSATDALSLQERYVEASRAGEAGDFARCISLAANMATIAPNDVRFAKLREECEGKKSAQELKAFRSSSLAGASQDRLPTRVPSRVIVRMMLPSRQK